MPFRPCITQTLVYLKLSVTGHFKNYFTHTHGPFWSIHPARILLLAVFGTQAIATLIEVYGGLPFAIFSAQ
jgi:H+-transporting ATPase